MTSFGKKSHRNLLKYMKQNKSTAFIIQHTLAPQSWYYIYGGKNQLSLTEPLFVLARPNRYDFKYDPETHEIVVKIPIQTTALGGSSAMSREEQTKIQQLRSKIMEEVLEDRIGLTRGGDAAAAQGLIIISRAGDYSIVEADKAYVIRLRSEDEQHPLGARLVVPGGRVPGSTGSTMETSSSNRSAGTSRRNGRCEQQ